MGVTSWQMDGVVSEMGLLFAETETVKKKAKICVENNFVHFIIIQILNDYKKVGVVLLFFGREDETREYHIITMKIVLSFPKQY